MDYQQATILAMTETAKEASRIHVEMHNQIVALQAEVARLTLERDQDKECARLTAEVERLRQELNNERERIIALLLYEGTDSVCTNPEIHHDLKIVSMGFDEKKLRGLLNGKD